MTNWLTSEELQKFRRVGRDARISRHAVFYGPENIEIGHNVRIDHGNLFLCSSGKLNIHNHVHLAAGSTYSCAGGIDILSHAQISFGCKLISASDDIGGDFLVGPTYDDEFRSVKKEKIIIGRLAVILPEAVVLPGTIMEDASVLAPLSMTKVAQRLVWCTMYGGVPAKELKSRSARCITLADDWERIYATQKTEKNRE